MKKVVIIGYVDKNNPSGPSVVVDSLIKGLDKLGVDFKFINLCSGNLMEKIEYLSDVIKLIFLKDVSVNVHTFGYKNPMLIRFLCKLNKSCSFYLTAHGILSFENELNGVYTSNQYVKLEKNLYGGTKNIICVSSFFKDIFIKKFGNKNNIYVVPNGLVSYTNEYIPKNEISFAYAGGFSMRKNPMACVNLFKDALSVYPEAKLYMCGPVIDSELREQTLEFITQNSLEDRVTILGNVSHFELNQIFEKSSFIVAPSMFDTFNMVVLEAMNRGCIPIVSDKCGIKEILQDRCGIVYKNINDVVGILKTMDIPKQSVNSFKLSLNHTYIEMTKGYLEVMGMGNE